MNASVGVTVNASAIGASFADEVSWHTTEPSLTEEEEGAIVTFVIVIIGVVAAIVVLFSMGILIDCRYQKKNGSTPKRMRLKMPPLGRRRNFADDGRSLASDMCPNGNSEFSARTDTTDAIV